MFIATLLLFFKSMKFFLSFSIFILLSACGGGGGGGASSWTNDINNVPTCSDTGTSFKTTEYNYMGGGSSSHGLGRVCASTAYANGATGSGIKVAIIDTGIAGVNSIYGNQNDGSVTHEDFRTVAYSMYAPSVRCASTSKIVCVDKSDVYRWDAFPNDEDGHGTHVAGIIGGYKNDKGNHGVAYDSILYPIKTMTPWGNRWSVQGRYSDAWGFYKAYYTADADIINNSWGYGGEIGVDCNSKSSCETLYESPAITNYSEAYDYFQATASYGGAISVWAAGNDGLSNPQALAGACIYDDSMKELCVIVSALGTDGKIASYSNKCGIASDYCISAPGSTIYSANYTFATYYRAMSGTSMAAPMVAGGLALIKQKFPSLTNAQVVDRLFAAAVDHDVYSQSSIYGHGLMDLGVATSNIGTLQIHASPNNRNIENSSYSELEENSFSSSIAFNKSLNLALKDKTMEVYDSFDRANFLVYIDGFFKKNHLENINSINNHLSNLLLTDDYEVTKINKFGKISFNSRSNLNNSLFTSFDKRVNIGNNTSANTFFSQSKKSIGISTPLINNKLYDNPYFYDGEQNLSLILNRDYFSSELFTNNEGTNFGYAINFQPTSKNYLDNDKYGDIEVSFGTMFEKNKILNSFSNGVFSTDEMSNTKFTRLKYNHSVDDLNLFANINFGSSEIKSNNNSYIGITDSIVTRSYALGLIKNNFLEHNNKFALIISQPQKVINGHMRLTVPTASNSDREVTYTDYNLNLDSSVTETNLDLFYIMKLTQNNSLYFNFTHINNPSHDASLNSHNNVSLVYKKFF